MTVATSSDSETRFRSFERVQHYPIVNDSFVLANKYYQWLKSKNSLLENTLERAEQTLKTIKDTAEPVAARKLSFFDNVVYNQLDRIEKRFPIVLESSSTITHIPVAIYEKTIQPPLQTLMWPVTKTVDIVSKTSTMAMGTIKNVLPLPDFTRKTTNYVLDKTEELLDNYLPDEDDCECKHEVCDSDIYTKFKRISDKTKRRIFRKTMKQIGLLLKSNKSILGQIDAIIENIQKKRQEMQVSLIEKYSNAVESVKETIPDLFSKDSNIIKNSIQYVKNLQKVVRKSTSANVEYLLKNALEGLSILNGALYKLQKYLNDWKPELVSDSILNHTNDVINEVRIGLDSFIQNMREALRKKFHKEGNSEQTESNESENESASSSEEGSSESD